MEGLALALWGWPQGKLQTQGWAKLLYGSRQSASANKNPKEASDSCLMDTEGDRRKRLFSGHAEMASLIITDDRSCHGQETLPQWATIFHVWSTSPQASYEWWTGRPLTSAGTLRRGHMQYWTPNVGTSVTLDIHSWSWNPRSVV